LLVCTAWAADESWIVHTTAGQTRGISRAGGGAEFLGIPYAPYVFGDLQRTRTIGGTYADVDSKLAELMETYWSNFAKTGNPNSAELPQWPEMDGSKNYMEFTQEGSGCCVQCHNVALSATCIARSLPGT
jgi:para-nitrobenzyl esterase